jgi:hypothetical protein
LEGGRRSLALDNLTLLYRPDGRAVAEAPGPPAPRQPVRLSAEEIRSRRLTLASRWDGARPDHGEIVASLV